MSDNIFTYVVYEYDQTDDKDIVYAGQDEEEARMYFNSVYICESPHHIYRGLETWILGGPVHEEFLTLETQRPE